MTYQILLRRARDNRLAALSGRPATRSHPDVANIFADLYDRDRVGTRLQPERPERT